MTIIGVRYVPGALSALAARSPSEWACAGMTSFTRERLPPTECGFEFWVLRFALAQMRANECRRQLKTLMTQRCANTFSSVLQATFEMNRHDKR
jgi:hypothetical protein